jgi:hypothetical protein
MITRTRFLTCAVALLAAVSAHAQTVGITDSIAGAFVDISTSGTALGLGDEGVVDVWPGFSLSQTLFTAGDGRVWISNNGAIGFAINGSFGAYFLNAELPDPALFGGSHAGPQALAVYWDDLDSDTGDVYYETVGTPGSRVFIVQWQDRPHYSGDAVLDGDEATFQVQIFEDATPGHAQFIYADVDFLDAALDEGASATIGYQADGIANDVQWSHNQAGAVTAGTVLTLVDVPCPNKGDGNADCHIDPDDCQEFVACLAGPSVPVASECECYDFGDNGTVDLADFRAFQEAYTGSTDTIPGCTP